jgi:hypothetical protein
MESLRKMFLRDNTTSKSDESKTIDFSRQQIVNILAIRGEGKSYLLDGFKEKYYYQGYLILDLHSPPNLENAFFCIPKLNSDEEITQFKRNPRPFLNEKKRKAFKITLVGSSTMRFSDIQVDMYNGRRITFEEWIDAGNSIESYPSALPPLKPRHSWNEELVRIVKIPLVTGKPESETNRKAWEVIEKVLLDCRKEGRVFTLNRKLFPNERQYFWTMALILRGIEGFSDKYLSKKFPHEFGLETRDMMKPMDKNWHKGVIITRELADLAPQRTKADVSGESTQVKKSMMGFARVVRHIDFDWISDWQKFTDVADSVRAQGDVFCYKKWSRDLAGDREYIFDHINAIRSAIIKKGRGKKIAFRVADTHFPPIEELSKFYYYTRFISGRMKLFTVPVLQHMHKEPDMKFHTMTGIYIDHDLTKLPTEKGSGDVVTDNANLKLLWLELKTRKDNGMKWADNLAEVGKMQKDGKITYHLDLSTMKTNTISALYPRICKIFADVPPPKLK